MPAMPPWSFSGLTNYETCPLKYYLTRVSKEVPDPPGEAAAWGTVVHSALEQRVRDKTPLPEALVKHEPLCVKFDSMGDSVFVERQYALDKNFEQVGWKDSAAWVRGIIDVGVVKEPKAVLLDWKTGKPKPLSDQLKLFAAFVFHTNPSVDVVDTGFVWLAYNKMTKETYHRGQVSEIWQEFLPRVRRMEQAYDQDKWEAKPSGLCRKYCPVGKKRCAFCGH